MEHQHAAVEEAVLENRVGYFGVHVAAVGGEEGSRPRSVRAEPAAVWRKCPSVSSPRLKAEMATESAFDRREGDFLGELAVAVGQTK